MSRRDRSSFVPAMIELIAESGFEALSVRAVAARAGASAGAVQHHFPSKDAMLAAAMDAIATLAAARETQLEAIDDPADRLHALVDLLIPADPAAPVTRVWLAYAARAAVDEGIRTGYRRLWSRPRAELRLLLAAAGGSPEEAETAAVELLALLDGLAVSVVAEGGAIDPATARAVARRRVRELLAREREVPR